MVAMNLAQLVRFVSDPIGVGGIVVESEGKGRWANIGGRNVWLSGKSVKLHKTDGGHVFEIHGDDNEACEVHYRQPGADGKHTKKHIATAPGFEAACRCADWHGKFLGNRAFEKPACECNESFVPLKQFAIEIGPPTRHLVFELAAPGLADGTFLPLNTGAKSYGDRIDTEKKVIRGTKICGEWSINTGRILGLDPVRYGKALEVPYRYNLRDKCHLYEGTAVYKGHRPFEFNQEGARVIKAGDRNPEDILGWFRNVRYVAGDGLYGDYHYLDSRPYNATVLEIARRQPDKVAFSHEAEYGENPTVVNGHIQLEPVGLDGVALVVSKPGTTKSLFESAA